MSDGKRGIISLGSITSAKELHVPVSFSNVTQRTRVVMTVMEKPSAVEVARGTAGTGSASTSRNRASA